MRSKEHAALWAQDLELAWGDGEPVVSGVSLSLDCGETVCLVGKSGVGKTTILHALAGLVRPRTGCVLIHGVDATGTPGRVGYMLQKDLLLPNLRVVDNACLPLLVAGTPKRQARAQAEELLAEFGLSAQARLWPHELSGGMRQRVAFARTCMGGNDTILLDEPFSALDAITRASVRTWFMQQVAERGLSVLMITHDAHEACALADRIYVLSSRRPATIAGEIALGEGDERRRAEAVDHVLSLVES